MEAGRKSSSRPSPYGWKSDTSFLKANLIFPLALSIGAERNGLSMPKQDISSRHFQRKISQFCELRIAPIASKRVLENTQAPSRSGPKYSVQCID
jgi:hypothetical protein